MLILKSREDLYVSKWKIFPGFDSLITESDIVSFLINLDNELKNTYFVYQELLFPFKNKNYNLLRKNLNNYNYNISSYMKTSIKTLLEFLPLMKNTFDNKYHNGYIEDNNNFIKTIKKNSQCLTHQLYK